MVWATGAKVVGSSPTGGILAQMCECACNASTHSLARNFPYVGLEPGPIALQSGNLPSSKTSQLGPRVLPGAFCKLRNGLGRRGQGFGFDPHRWHFSANMRMCM